MHHLYSNRAQFRGTIFGISLKMRSFERGPVHFGSCFSGCTYFLNQIKAMSLKPCGEDYTMHHLDVNPKDGCWDILRIPLKTSPFGLFKMDNLVAAPRSARI